MLGAQGQDQHTLAHELTHVIQQRQGAVAGTDDGSGLQISDPTDRFERAAEANAQRVMAASPAGRPASPTARATTSGTVQRLVSVGTNATDRLRKRADPDTNFRWSPA